MFRNPNTLILTVLLGLGFALASTSDASAQVGSRSRTQVNRLGNSNIGIDFVAWARTKNTSGTSRVDTVLRTPLRFLGYTGEMHRLAVTATRTSSRFSGSYSLKLAGTTRRVGTVSSRGNRSFREHMNVFSSDPSMTFWVGPVPITVSGNIGFTGVMDMYFADYGSSSRGVAIAGKTESYGYGFSEIGLGVSGFQAGIRQELRLGQQKFDGYLGAFRSYLSTAYLDYSFTPVRLLLKLFAELGWWRAWLTVVDRSAFGQTFSPFL